MKRQTFNISGMSCAACSARVQDSVNRLDGVDKCDVNLLKNSMTVAFDESKLSDSDIINAVDNAGYKAEIRSKTVESAEKLKKKADKILLKLIISIVLLVLLMVVSMGHIVGLNIFSSEQFILKGIIELIISVPIISLNFKYFISGFKALFKLNPNMDSLIAVGSATSLIYSVYLVLSGGAHHYYFESASMILVFVTIGKYLESKSKAKTTEAVTRLMDLTPKTSIILVDGTEKEIPSENILKGHIVIVKSGMTFPADGRVIFGEGSADESAITGESLPISKNNGDYVTGGTQLISGYVQFEAEKVGEETTLSEIIRLVDQATNTNPKIARFADKISRVFVPIVFFIAIVSTVVWLFATKDVGLSLNFGIAVLVISCPCALGLATPTAIMVGTGKAAELGVLVKSAEIFEIGGKVKSVMFDKTGTITTGKPEVTDFEVTDNDNKLEILKSVTAIEKMSDHPLANAIVSFGIDSNEVVRDYNYVSSKGVEAVVNGIEYKIGNYDFVKVYAKENHLLVEKAKSFSQSGKTSLYVVRNEVLCAVFGIADKLKESSIEAVKLIENDGIKTVMLTGDNELTAKEICKNAGIQYYEAELMPADKNKAIKKYQRSAPVIMVGDGINDSPALAVADIGIAVGSGTDIAMEAADVVLIRDDMRDVHTVIRLCRKVLKNIKENLFWALIYNTICIPVAAGVFYPVWGFQLPPMFGTIAMSLSSICVVTNALRIKNFKRDFVLRKETKMKTVYIDGMMCPHCQARVREILSTFDANVQVDLESKCAKLKLDTDNDKITEAITNAGYKVVNIEE
ncbi:MAG: heavy metal translocating P-type ATPase [Clostridia bacterium]|nr:heavy metal translocating P-type ATPase [Clostridia bacterium]